MSETKLLPCPFCGAPAVPIHDLPGENYTMCSSPSCGGRQAMRVDQWNRRAGSAGIHDPEAFVKAHRELVEAAKGALVLLDLAGLCPPVNNQLAKALAACEAGKEKA